ncbi:MAG: M23 family metallopeptidase [Clostridia bacterium]|nr:M23 family metallopeptidase [Clostridia bacterium]
MRFGFTVILAAALAVVSAFLLARPADASVADLAEHTAGAAVEVGDTLSGRLPSFWQASVGVGRREAARRLSALGFSEDRDVSLSSLLRPVTPGGFARLAARFAGLAFETEEDALSFWRGSGFTLDGETVTCGEAACLLVRIFGYPMPDSDVGRDAAALAACRTLRIDGFDADAPLTWGDAALLFFRALDTTDASGVCPADRLMEDGVLSESDVSVLLREPDTYTVDTYLWASGYETEGPAAGYFSIALTSAPEWQLNALMNKENTDTDGLAVPLWGATSDSSQTFRFELQEDGTYLVYCAASKGGYNRVLGFHKKGYLALYKPTSSYALAFYLRSAGEDEWYFLSAKDPSLCLTVSGEPGKNVKLALAELGSAPEGQVFSLTRRGAIDEDGAEVAIFPAPTVRITQGAYDGYSHAEQNAIDVTIPGKRAFAPFTAKVVRIDTAYEACNAVWIQSCEPVLYADGTLDYMTVIFMHDDSIRDLSVGQVIMQGQYFYDMGTAGNASGAHIHIAVLRGAFTKKMHLTGSGDVFAEDAFFLLPETEVAEDNALAFRCFVPEDETT